MRKVANLIFVSAVGLCVSCTSIEMTESWQIDTTEQWQQAEKGSAGLTYADGQATPVDEFSSYRSKIHRFSTKRSVKDIVIKQSPVWQNWTAIKNYGPANLLDAPVSLTIGPGNYWIFGRYDGGKKDKFKSEKVSLAGYDIPLWTTPWDKQFDAEGGLKKPLGGYHAWQSKDMVNWVHHGPVTKEFSRWVTTAEYIDGKAYIYYDYPNDQDPHLYIDDNLFDGVPGKNMGMVFKDPSHGSDCSFIRDLEGKFHVIYEDWSPINAREHSWDSPLAGHAISPDGKSQFEILSPAVDRRTTPTGKIGEYQHLHWKSHPDWHTNTGKYEIHSPEQSAYGDWAAISIGGQYYLFSDYHPANDKIRLAWFTSSDINKPFEFCGQMGMGHPDPDISFAEGKFYLKTQLANDFISPGPWVEKVEVRVGVATKKDGEIDVWTEWQQVKETYDYIEGFSKQIKRIPASINLSNQLPPGFGFGFEIRTKDTTENQSKPILDSVNLSFEKAN